MEAICPKNKCTGCAACYNICGKGAIAMVEDACGYIHPRIDLKLCVDCGLCAKVCPVNTKAELRYPLDCYAATVKDSAELASCASGGLATVLSRFVIGNGGVVYGCTGQDIRNVRHIRVDRPEGLGLLKGSKYVQSFIGSVYKEVRRDLQSGRQVLFIGTPCQVAGLQGFLRRKEYPNLITVDLVCHGVPSQRMLNDSIALCCGDEDVKVWFRQKERGSSKCDAPWRIAYGWFFQTNHMRVPRSLGILKSPYMLGFLAPLTFRDSCFSCRYATISRCGDFTLGDFWGLGNDSGLELGKGVSAVLLNTEKAIAVWNEIKGQCVCVKRDIVEAQKGNGQLQVPSVKHCNYEKFVSLYPSVGFKRAVYASLKKDLLKKRVRNAKNYIRMIVRRMHGFIC